MNAKLAAGLLIAIVGGAAVVLLRSKRTDAAAPVIATSTTAPPTASPSPNLDGLPHDDRSPATQAASNSSEAKASAPVVQPKPVVETESDLARFIVESDRKWKAKYEGMSVAELEAARDAIETSLDEQTHPILMEMLKAGRSTPIPPDAMQIVVRTPLDSLEISMIQSQQGVGWFRATLPQEEYPELYELKREDVWLSTIAIGRQTAVESPTGR
jgi:hypothetical protein